jgi:hypothetical protein
VAPLNAKTGILESILSYLAGIRAPRAALKGDVHFMIGHQRPVERYDGLSVLQASEELALRVDLIRPAGDVYHGKLL